MIHDKGCLAAALICAVENFRDDGEFDIAEFTRRVSDGSLLATAEGYLFDGLTACRCAYRVNLIKPVRPWQCITCAARFATLDDIDAHLDDDGQCPNRAVPRVELAGARLHYAHGWPRAWVRACTDEARTSGLAVRPLVAARADIAAYV